MYNRLEKIMKLRGLTAYRIAKSTNIAQATFSDWKSGKSTPKSDKIKKIADFLEVGEDYFSSQGIVKCPYCDLGYCPDVDGEIEQHEEQHQKYRKAVDKFGFCWTYNEREEKKAKGRNDVTNSELALDERVDAQINVFKALFSRSLLHNQFNLEHPPIDKYIAMLLNQAQFIKNVPSDVYSKLVNIYGTLPGINDGTTYGDIHQLQSGKTENPTTTNDSRVSDDDIKFAVFGTEDVSDEVYDTLKRLAQSLLPPKNDKEK